MWLIAPLFSHYIIIVFCCQVLSFDGFLFCICLVLLVGNGGKLGWDLQFCNVDISCGISINPVNNVYRVSDEALIFVNMPLSISETVSHRTAISSEE